MEDREEGGLSHRGSRATSPGGCWRESSNSRYIEVSGLRDGVNAGEEEYQTITAKEALQKPSRYRPRTFPYQRYLPYPHHDHQYDSLEKCVRQLYIAISAGDFVPGATHWTRELKGWIQLKFNLPREDRVKLTKLYYELALAPGMDKTAAERFGSMFMTLTKCAAPKYGQSTPADNATGASITFEREMTSILTGVLCTMS